jgi:predicted MPP superfamily phosphohydrolase
MKLKNLRHIVRQFFSREWHKRNLQEEFGLLPFGKRDSEPADSSSVYDKTAINVTYSKKNISEKILEYTLVIEDKTKNNIKFPELDCLFISDMHLDKRIEKQKLSEILDYINNSDYDFICIVGDIFDDGLIDAEEYRDFFKELRESNKNIIITTGNHDYCGHNDADCGKLAPIEKFLSEFKLEISKNRIITLKKDNKFYSLVCLDDIYSSEYSKGDGKALLLDLCKRKDISKNLKEKIKNLAGKPEICPGYFCMTRKYIDIFSQLDRKIPFGILVHSLDSMNHILSDYLEEKGIHASFIMTGHTHSGEANFKVFPTDFTVSGTFFLSLKGSYFDINDHYCSKFSPIAKILESGTISIANPGLSAIIEKIFRIKRFGAFQPGIVRIRFR